MNNSHKIYTKSFIFFAIISSLFFSSYQVKASGIESAQVAKELMPYASKIVATTGKTGLNIVKDTLGVLWLPVGALQTTVGAPFGFFKKGVGNIGSGIAAPFKVAKHVVLYPFDVMKCFGK